MVPNTRGSYNEESYIQGVLTKRGSFNYGSYNKRFLQPEVL